MSFIWSGREERTFCLAALTIQVQGMDNIPNIWLTSVLAALPAVSRTAPPLQLCHYFVFDSVCLLCARLGPGKQEHFKPIFSGQTGVEPYVCNYIMLSYMSNVSSH